MGSLERDFRGTVPKEEFDTLLYDVSFNGVNEEIRHVLDSEMARYGELNADLMYDAVKKHEAYMAHHQCLRAKPTQPSTTPTPAPRAPVGGHFKPRFQRPSARVAAAVEDLGPTPINIEFETEGEVEEESTDAPSSGSGGLFIPEFLEDLPDGGLMMKMVQAIKAEEEKRKKCFACQSPDHFIRDCPVAKNGRGPPQPREPPKKQTSSCGEQGQGNSLSTHSAGAGGPAPTESPRKCFGKLKDGTKPVPCLNPDPFKHFIGPKNWGEAFIDGELTTCLLDNGAQLNFMTPAYAAKRNLNVFSLECLTQEIGGPLPPIRGIGGILVEPTGFVLVNVQVPCVKGYNEDKIIIVLDDPSMGECPIILGTPTLYRVMQVIKESEITKLATQWAMSRFSWLARTLHATVAQTPMDNIAN